MTDKTKPDSQPTTPATRSGKKYVHSSLGSGSGSGEKLEKLERRAVFKKPPTMITPGGSTSQLSIVTTASPDPPPRKQNYEYKDALMTFGDDTTETIWLDTKPLFRIAGLLGLCVTKGIHVFDFILERRLLANSADELQLTRLLSDSFKGDSKPLEEELQFGDDALLGTLHWRTRASPKGHLVQGIEGNIRDLHNRSFIWAVPLISVWPPPLTMGPDVKDNILWEFELQNQATEQKALETLAGQLENDYRGAFFAMVRY